MGIDLAPILASETTIAVPVGLAATVVGAATGAAGYVTSTVGFLRMTKLQVGLATAVLIGGTAGLVLQSNNFGPARKRSGIAK